MTVRIRVEMRAPSGIVVGVGYETYLTGKPPHNRSIATMPYVSLQEMYFAGTRRTATPGFIVISPVREIFQVKIV